MGTPLDEIFDTFYSLIKDTDLGKLSEEDLYKLTKVYYEMASTRFKECKKNLELIKVEENYYVTDILSIEERNIIAQGMVYYWIESKANYNKLMKNQINTKDFNQLSNANVLLRLNELLDFYRREFNRLRKAYTRNYDDFEGWS
ncbi:MAG: hypothetical protein II309_05990 [Bacilli bacterium]|jgi:hypothetical protein|nr:hypothetical protein [Bacilli bacterium]